MTPASSRSTPYSGVSSHLDGKADYRTSAPKASLLIRKGRRRGATEEEIEFLKRLRIKGKRPTALYYYRELQNLRDPLNFRSLMTQTPQAKIRGDSQPEGSVPPTHKYQGANGIQKQLQLDGRKRSTRRWAGNKGSRGKKQKAKS